MNELIVAEPPRTERVKELKQLRCSKCGVTTDAACDCEVGYVPAHEYAARAVAANPEMSDNAIAEVIGVDHKTVGEARKSVGGDSLTAKRIGKDGKRYPATKSKRHAQPTPAPTMPAATPTLTATPAQAPAVVSLIDEMQPEQTALLLTQIEQLIGKLALAVEHGVRSDIFDGRVRAVADRLVALIKCN